MSERKPDHQNGDQNNAGQSESGGTQTPPNNGKPAVLTIEEHAKNMKVDAPVFAAVMQSKNWASGKKVPSTDFDNAVKEFLGAPIGGK